MSLNCVTMSDAKKTAGCAVTYKSGEQNMFGTCPDTCKLKPADKCGSTEIDLPYWKAVRNAKPRRGASFTYSHFPPSLWPDANRDGVTTVNYSADTPRAAAMHTASGTASVTVVPQTWWGSNHKHTFVDGVRGVRCPAEYLPKFSCADCGGGDPLCARWDRDYFVTVVRTVGSWLLYRVHGARRIKAVGRNLRRGRRLLW